jgi:hypothetical protein
MAAPRAGINGLAVALASGGALLVYAGLRGENPLESLRAVLTGTPPSVPVGKPVTLAPLGGIGGGDFPSGGASSLVQAAEKYLGVKYRWGGKDPRTGLDCSGLVFVAFRDIGITAPMSTATQRFWKSIRVVSSPAPGDLAYWPGHIGIVVGPDKMINAPHTGAVVRYDTISGHRSTTTVTYLRYIGTSGTIRSSIRVPGQAQP